MNESRGTTDDGRPRNGVAGTRSALGLLSRSSLGSLVLLASLIVCAGCTDFLRGRDGEIQDATRAIEIARDDGQRAKAYSSRGTAYSEKARYSRISKLISNDEYER